MDYLDRLDEEKIIYGEYPGRKHIENYEEILRRKINYEYDSKK